MSGNWSGQARSGPIAGVPPCPVAAAKGWTDRQARAEADCRKSDQTPHAYQAEAVVAVWEAEWENNLLEAALTKVRRRTDPQKYQIFDFYVNKEWSPEKVAERFNVTVDQVYLIKHRLTEAIRTEVKRLQVEIT